MWNLLEWLTDYGPGSPTMTVLQQSKAKSLVIVQSMKLDVSGVPSDAGVQEDSKRGAS